MLFEQATDIDIFHGQAANHAHDESEINFKSKTESIGKLEKSLTDMGKNVKVNRC